MKLTIHSTHMNTSHEKIIPMKTFNKTGIYDNTYIVTVSILLCPNAKQFILKLRTELDPFRHLKSKYPPQNRTKILLQCISSMSLYPYNINSNHSPHFLYCDFCLSECFVFFIKFISITIFP